MSILTELYTKFLSHNHDAALDAIHKQGYEEGYKAGYDAASAAMVTASTAPESTLQVVETKVEQLGTEVASTVEQGIADLTGLVQTPEDAATSPVEQPAPAPAAEATSAAPAAA